MFNPTIIGNPDTVRTECEIADSTGAVVAIVYDSTDGWQVELFRELLNSEKTAFDASVVDAKQRLSQYANRIGANPPDGLTAGGLSLWLLGRHDASWMDAPHGVSDPEAQNRLHSLSADIKNSVVALAVSGQQIQAIRQLRAQTNCSLDEAKGWLKDNCS